MAVEHVGLVGRLDVNIGDHVLIKSKKTDDERAASGYVVEITTTEIELSCEDPNKKEKMEFVRLGDYKSSKYKLVHFDYCEVLRPKEK